MMDEGTAYQGEDPISAVYVLEEKVSRLKAMMDVVFGELAEGSYGSLADLDPTAFTQLVEQTTSSKTTLDYMSKKIASFKQTDFYKVAYEETYGDGAEPY